MNHLRSLAQEAANASRSRCWVVYPRHGQPYIAYRAGQIAPGYQELITVLPAAGYCSRWDPTTVFQ